MSASNTISAKVDLREGIQRVRLGRLFAENDKAAHTIAVTVLDGGTAADLSGYTISAYFIRPDEATVTVSGTLTNNIATVSLPASCYAKPGYFSLIVKALSEDINAAIFWADGTITRSTTDIIVDPSHIVPSLEELLAQIAAMEAATAKVNNMTVSATAVAAGGTPTATITEEGADNHKHIAFGLVTGNTGAVPNISVGTVTTGAAGSSASVERRSGSPDTAPVFDFTIPQGDKGDTGNTGETGQTGPQGVSVASVAKAYQEGTSATTPPSGTWLDSPPTVDQGNYLWTRLTITLDDTPATVTTAYSVAYQGQDGSGSVSTVDGISPVSGNITLPVMTGATSSTAGAAGKVPAPSAGDQDKRLGGDGTWRKSWDELEISIATTDWSAAGQDWPHDSGGSSTPPSGETSLTCYRAEITSGTGVSSCVNGDDFKFSSYTQAVCPADIWVYIDTGKVWVASTKAATGALTIKGLVLHM